MAKGGWHTHTYLGGKYQPIKDLIAEGKVGVAVDGNSAEGWHVVMFTTESPHATVDVSPVFAREFGDTMRHLVDAAERVYGVRPRKYKLEA